MKENIAKFARLGLVHHLLYPESVYDQDLHAATLLKFIRRSDIETFDCCLPFGTERRQKLIAAIKACGKEAVYAAHLFPLAKISFGSLIPAEQEMARMFLKDQIAVATAINAAGFMFASGLNYPAAEQRARAKIVFRDFCLWLCGALSAAKIAAFLEPFDTDFDKKFLYGSSAECVELIESLKPEVDNLQLELDMAHVPLMHETFRQAVKTCAPHLGRIHLGNCVKKNRRNPWYGDKHPPLGIAGGEIDINELAGIFGLLLEIGYLKKEKRGALVFEMQPYPGKTPEETVAITMEKAQAAWKMV